VHVAGAVQQVQFGEPLPLASIDASRGATVFGQRNRSFITSHHLPDPVASLRGDRSLL
jgi:hypothetical protein